MKRLLPIVFASLVVTHAWAAPTTPDPARLKLGSANALVIDAESDRPIYAKAADEVTPIASVTKLMTAMVVLDANQPMDAPIEIDKDDIDYLKGSHSRLEMGATLSRREMLRLALMSSENRAASSLARYYPGGTVAAVAAMNHKAAELGMTHTHYADPTGLSPHNVSTAVDLAKLVQTAATYPLIRQFTTTPEHSVEINPTGRSLCRHAGEHREQAVRHRAARFVWQVHADRGCAARQVLAGDGQDAGAGRPQARSCRESQEYARQGASRRALEHQAAVHRNRRQPPPLISSSRNGPPACGWRRCAVPAGGGIRALGRPDSAHVDRRCCS